MTTERITPSEQTGTLLTKIVHNKDGNIEVIDMFLNGKWIGSKRTFAQVRDTAKYYGVLICTK